MNLVALADIHGRTGRLSALDDLLGWADVILLTGDLTHFGGREQALKVLERLEEYGRPLLAVPGNCDYPEVGALLSERGVNLDGTVMQVQGADFVGLGGSIPGPVPTPNELSEEEIHQRLDAAAERLPGDRPAIFVSHQPPKDSVADRTTSGHHVGSISVAGFISRVHPLICFTGHIHESSGGAWDGETLIINPGPLGAGGCASVVVEAGKVASWDLHRLG